MKVESGILGVIGIILGYLLRPLDTWIGDVVTSRKERAQRRADFQRDTLINLQQALYDVDRTAGSVPNRNRALGAIAGQPDPVAIFQDATNRVNMYRVRLEDAELTDAVLKFYGAAMQQATGIPRGDDLNAIESKQQNLDRANERIGVLLKALH